jgi:hypothetical protein
MSVRQIGRNLFLFFFLRLQKVLSNTKKNGEEMILSIAILYV